MKFHLSAYPSLVKLLLVLSLTIAACDLSPLPQATPTIDITATPTITLTMAVPTPDVTATNTLVPVLATSTFTNTPSEPTSTFTPSPTPGPLAYTMQTGDTFYYIVQRPPFNYTTSGQINAMIPEFLRVNPSIRNIDSLPGAGSIIYIPLQPPTPTPEGFDLTQTAAPNLFEPSTLPENAEVLEVPVQENDTILRFVQEYETTLNILATLNPDKRFFGCDFSNPSGGPECSVLLGIGEMINVPAPTPTPTLSPTFSGSETPTSTPTHSAPVSVFPPQNGIAPARTFQLQWIGLGSLQSTEVYFVEIQDLTAETSHQNVTRSTSYELPAEFVPSDGQSHEIQWRVSIAARDMNGTYSITGAQGVWRTFTWQSR